MADRPIALVTGATRGIGAAIAQDLSEHGYFVIGTATSVPGAERISTALGEQGTGEVLNVCEREKSKELIKKITEAHGSVKVLVNNAGITRDNLSLRMKSEEWDSVIDTNLSALFFLSQACLRGMVKARWGRIISIGSVVGSMGNAGQANYAAAKAGVLGLTRSLARELGSRNITVNAVAPGYIQTDMTDQLDDSQRDALSSNIPVGRLGSTQDIAKTVSFLASEAAGYITGEVIHVNGGLYMD